MAALAKILAVCAGTVGGAAACAATGVIPAPVALVPGTEKAAVERPAESAKSEAESSLPPVDYEPQAPPVEATVPAPEPEGEKKQVSEPRPEPEAEAAASAGAVEYAPPPAPPPAATASSPSSGAATSSGGDASGEFGP